MIETIVSHQHNLTLYKCYGDLKEAEINDIIQPYYTERTTLNLLWDFSEASMSDISSMFVRQITNKMRELVPAREKGKIAVIAPKDLEYGIARMFQILSDERRFPFKVKVFKYVGEACQWLLLEE